MALAIHKFTIGTQEHFIKLIDNYDSTGSTIGSALGISRKTDTDSGEGVDRVSVGSALKEGKGVKLSIVYIDATSSKRKSAKVFCPIDKAKTAINDIIGKNYRGGEVKSASFPRRRRLS